MARQFLDTNVIIRYATKDHPSQSARALAFLQQVELGDREVTTSEAVLVEVVQVLTSKNLYSVSRENIRAILVDILELRGLHLPYKRTYLRALDLYATFNVDFVDALNVAHMERAGIPIIVSFDQDFDRIPGISRVEP